MHYKVYGLYALITLFFACTSQAASPIWQDLNSVQARGAGESTMRRFGADDAALRVALARASNETSGDRSQRIELPLPDGSVRSYVVVESPIMEDELAARFPELRTYRVFDPDTGRSSGRLSISPSGFRGLLRTPRGRVFIDPDTANSLDHVYVSRLQTGASQTPFRCEVHGDHQDLENWLGPRMRSAARVPGALLQYRLAVGVTREYYQYFGSDDGLVTGAITNTINRVNDVYESDLGIRLVLVGNNQLLYEKSDEGLNNDSAIALLTQANGWIDSRLPGGDSAYDIGHMFYRPSFIGGGLAFLGAVCDDANKAGGVTGLPDPAGDPFDIDYVAHEIGHQFDAEHSFNGTTGNSCGSGRWGPSAYEPGSGATIMGYAGLCGAENLQNNTSPTFHANSIAEINRFTQTGGDCFQPVSTSTAYGLPVNNSDPSIAAIPDSIIPANTPFILDGSATDPDGDTPFLTFQWDQMDNGCPTDAGSFGTDTSDNPLFRSYVPRDDSWRNFPALGTQLAGLYDRAEVLPCQDRSLNFRLTARDGKSGLDFEDLRLTVVKAAGPFEITNLDTPAQSLPSGVGFDVEWNAAGTDQAPINCANVDIDLMAFSDSSYTRYTLHRLASSVANAPGIANVSVTPAGARHPRARIRVKCSTGPFYALSAEDLEITGAGARLDDDDRVTQFTATPAQTSVSPPVCPTPRVCTNEETVKIKRDRGGTAVDIWWLLALAALAPLARRRRAQSLH